jgi:hypothetical protein
MRRAVSLLEPCQRKLDGYAQGLCDRVERPSQTMAR